MLQSAPVQVVEYAAYGFFADFESSLLCDPRQRIFKYAQLDGRHAFPMPVLPRVADVFAPLFEDPAGDP